MNNRRTTLLALLLMASLIGSALAWGRLASSRAAALSGRGDLIACRTAIAELTASGAAPASASTPKIDDLNRRFRAAAATAGLTDQQLPSVEPGRPVRMEETSFQRMPIFLGFERLTLQQLVTFLHQLSASDAHCRAQTIELSLPEGEVSPNIWRADLELSYLIHSPGASPEPARDPENQEDAR